VRKVIVGEVLARQQVIDKSKSLLWTFAHGNGHCAVQFDSRGWLNPKQLDVEQRNLAPVRGCCGGTLGVNGRNGRLQSGGTKAARSKSAFGERDAFGDLVLVPQRPILLLQQDQVSVGGGSGGAARLVQQHEPQQAHYLGKNALYDKIEPNWNVSGTAFCDFRPLSRIKLGLPLDSPGNSNGASLVRLRFKENLCLGDRRVQRFGKLLDSTV
jgi:hypothetical protein